MSRESNYEPPKSKGYSQPLVFEDYAYTPCTDNGALADTPLEAQKIAQRTPFEEFGYPGSGAGRK